MVDLETEVQVLQVQGKCIQLPVPNAGRKRKYLSSQKKASLFIAGNATRNTEGFR